MQRAASGEPHAAKSDAQGRRRHGLQRATEAAAWALALAAALVGCNRPCDQLAQRLCERASTDEACEAWKERIGRVQPASCEAGLRALDQEALR